MLNILVIVKNNDETLLQISRKLVENGEEITFLIKRNCENITALQDIGIVYILNGDQSESSIKYSGWGKLIENSLKIITWS